MSANPISELEFEAYCRRTYWSPTVWESNLLLRLDDTALRVWGEKAGARTPPQPAEEGIPVTNVAAIGGLIRGMAARRGNKQGR